MIADGAHNIGAIKEAVSYINQIEYKKLHIILGVVADKEWDKIMALLPQDAIYYFTKADIPRAMDENHLMMMASNYKLKGKAFPNAIEAKDKAMAKAGEEDLILILGSIYLVGEII